MENGYSSWRSTIAWSQEIPHYYGDYVRPLFIAMAVLSFVAMPLWGDLLPVGIIPQVGASLLLVLLAALTSARNLPVMLVNATVAGVSVVLLETVAIVRHHVDTTPLFLAREAGVLLMLAALYFGVKTIRSMLTGKIGHQDSPLEFDETAEPIVPPHPEMTFDPIE
jgi:Ni/Fe-hydrogenase subunit HybB-like protein